MTTTQIEEKLTEVKNKLNNDKQELEGSRKERAKLFIKGEKTIEIDRKIFRLEHITDNAPAIISELENRLATEKQEQAEQDFENLISEQKTVALCIQDLSKELVKNLKKASKINKELRQEHNKYVELLGKTDRQVISQNVTRGSEGMLDYVLSYCEQELAGNRPTRFVMPPPCPAI